MRGRLRKLKLMKFVARENTRNEYLTYICTWTCARIRLKIFSAAFFLHFLYLYLRCAPSCSRRAANLLAPHNTRRSRGTPFRKYECCLVRTPTAERETPLSTRSSQSIVAFVVSFRIAGKSPTLFVTWSLFVRTYLIFRTHRLIDIDEIIHCKLLLRHFRVIVKYQLRIKTEYKL